MSVLMSIIIPVYNCEHYLPQCVDSLVAYPLSNMEIWLVNDGSTDSSEQICQNYAQKYSFIHTFSQKNAGPSAARNAGLERATGEYIAFFDSDDYIDARALEKTLHYLSQFDGDIWGADFHMIAAQGEWLETLQQIPDASSPTNTLSMQDFLGRHECFWNVWRYIFKKNFLQQHHLRFVEGFHCAEDMEFMVHALTATEKVIFYHNPYYFYRTNYAGASLSQRGSLERLQSVVSMIHLSLQHLAQAPISYRQDMINKITREYMFQLAWYHDLPKEERPLAKHLFGENRRLLRISSRFPEHFVFCFLEIFRFPCTAFLFYLMKYARRRWKSFRLHRYSKKQSEVHYGNA